MRAGLSREGCHLCIIGSAEGKMAQRRRRRGRRGKAINASWSTGIVMLVVGSGVIWWIVSML
jgi:hypothetical protein